MKGHICNQRNIKLLLRQVIFQQMYHKIPRQQKLKQILDSFPDKENSAKRKLYLIDSTFKHKQMSECGWIQKTLMWEKVNQLIQKEKRVMKEEQMVQEDEEFQDMERNLGKYVKTKEQNKLLKFQQRTKPKTLLKRSQPETKKVYIQRKYNNKLAYQMHTIMQAKKIEDDKQKIKRQLNKGYQSPLIRTVLKVVANQKQTDRSLHDKVNKTSFFKRQTDLSTPDLSFDSKNRTAVLNNTKIKESMGARERSYVSPIKIDNKNALRKNKSSIYFVSARVSPKKHMK